LSEHRRRSPGRNGASHRPRYLLPLTAVAITAILGVTLGGYFVLRATRPGPVAVIAAVLPGSRAMEVLEQQRQQMIVMEAASHTMHLVGIPEVAAIQDPAASTGSAGSAGSVSVPAPNPGSAQSIAFNMMSSFGFDPNSQFSCLDDIWTRESGWRWNAANASGAYGIPQALPGSKMATAGSDWQTNPATQIKWGLGYIQSTYGTPCSAWSFWQAHGWY
jgi:anti-sigma-K factor RskA